MSRTPVTLMDPVSAAWISWCEHERVPGNTIRRRRSVLRSVGNAGVATREEIEEWWTTRRHLADTSRANDLAVLRSFYTWCQVWEHRSDNPTIRLASPRPAAGAPKPFSRRDLDQILEHVADDAPLRRAVLLGAWAGLRVSEAAALHWSDVDPETRRARVTGKGRKTRSVTFSRRLMDELLPDTAGNVVTGSDRAWAGGTLGRKVNAAIANAGVHGTFHKLRHRYGSVAYQRTKDPKALADQMGHASVATTMSFYAAAADEAAQAIADAVSDDD
ncbi:tyrosine-type recombinase/integrase [Nocardioides sp.]|uniref:tyrosine-type recombinase/integrase n=1 Tax=Nocardioides sp. TaxID=35761 RepID=UPI002C16CC8E|nr:tyrosine-type recombinase/integrase [Nocardioides sp.]HXH77338.1 tyrosine-type recombinase/integrase [Nocardioides sp.]